MGYPIYKGYGNFGRSNRTGEDIDMLRENKSETYENNNQEIADETVCDKSVDGA